MIVYMHYICLSQFCISKINNRYNTRDGRENLEYLIIIRLLKIPMKWIVDLDWLWCILQILRQPLKKLKDKNKNKKQNTEKKYNRYAKKEKIESCKIISWNHESQKSVRKLV